jgi:DnaJ-domain-containing protein 1
MVVPGLFGGRAQSQGEGVQAALELGGEHFVHPTRPFDPAEAGECLGDDEQIIVGLAARPGAGVAGMATAVVDEAQPRRLELLSQQGEDAVFAGGHGPSMPHHCAPRKRRPRSVHSCISPLSKTRPRPQKMLMTRRSQRSRAYAPDPEAPGRTCDMPGCGAVGEYRAPRSRQQLREWWWLCLDHVRSYNAAWDFYKGMSPAEIESALRADTAWQRPTWPLGRLGSTIDVERLHDPLHIFAAAGIRPGDSPRPGQERTAPMEVREPLAVLGLDWPLTMEELKARYKQLAKRHHPDANNGDRAAEERLKTINLAYAAVRSRLAASPSLVVAG